MDVRCFPQNSNVNLISPTNTLFTVQLHYIILYYIFNIFCRLPSCPPPPFLEHNIKIYCLANTLCKWQNSWHLPILNFLWLVLSVQQSLTETKICRCIWWFQVGHLNTTSCSDLQWSLLTKILNFATLACYFTLLHV